jgi:phasin family protein
MPTITEVKPVETKPADANVKKLVNDAAQNGAAQARKLIDDGAAQARITMEKSVEQVNKAAEGIFKAAEEAAEFSRGNVEAVAKATQAYVVGVQDLSRQSFALFQGLTDQALENARALSSVKSLKEAAELQASFARSAMERTFSESAKLQEAALKLAETAFAPLSARVTVAVEKITRPIAA